MGRYVARRLLQFIPVFFGATFIIFAAVYLLPGDPIRALAGDRALPEQVMETIRERYNLNDPFLVQYGKYIGGLFRGDFGLDFGGRPVSAIISQRFPITLKLGLMAFAIEIVIGLIAGVVAGLRQKSFADSLVLVSTTLVISIPVFVLGFLAQVSLGVGAGLFPIAYNPSRPTYSLLLPALVLASLSTAYIARLTRTSLVENLRADYVRTATAKGLPRSAVIGKHTLRNSLIPVVTFLGADLGALMGGAIVTEGIFNVPGIGLGVFRAITQQEPAVVVGIVTLLTLIYLISTLLVDLLYAVIDPRIRYE
jgi:oligopeptide transport system permease protein